MNNKNIQRRQFIKSLISNISTFGVGIFFVSKQAKALSILEQLPQPKTNSLQDNLLKEPKRQMLLAEDADCIAYSFGPPSKMKTKCLSGWGDM